VRAFYTLSGIIILAIGATFLTEATLAVGHRNTLIDDAALVKASPTASPTPTPTPKPTTSPSATPVATATPAAPAAATAVTNSFVHLRAGASTGTPIVADLNGGTTVTLGAYRDSQWQQVTYNGVNGYIYRSYLTY
jgi:uncharacterized protein YgiM (DUF1202 family)